MDSASDSGARSPGAFSGKIFAAVVGSWTSWLFSSVLTCNQCQRVNEDVRGSGADESGNDSPRYQWRQQVHSCWLLRTIFVKYE